MCRGRGRRSITELSDTSASTSTAPASNEDGLLLGLKRHPCQILDYGGGAGKAITKAGVPAGTRGPGEALPVIAWVVVRIFWTKFLLSAPRCTARVSLFGLLPRYVLIHLQYLSTQVCKKQHIISARSMA